MVNWIYHARKMNGAKRCRNVPRVWRVDLDEAVKCDLSLAEGCDRGIDVLLVFVSEILTFFMSDLILHPGWSGYPFKHFCPDPAFHVFQRT